MNSVTPSEATVREAIRQAAARHPGVSVEEIRGKSKDRRIVLARHDAWAILSAKGYGAAPIARRWPCDHTTILNARQRVREREGASA